jgi:hypothetical protein
MGRRPDDPQAGAAYSKLWRMVDGAVRDALTSHPEYLTSRGMHANSARRSIVKRVTGTLMGFVVEDGRRRRLDATQGREVDGGTSLSG